MSETPPIGTTQTVINEYALITQLLIVPNNHTPDKDTLISLYTGHIAVLQRELDSIIKKPKEKE